MIRKDPVGPDRMGRFSLWMILPVALALGMMILFAMGLGREGAQDLPSALIDKPVPAFDLPALREGEPGLGTADLVGDGVKLVNIWASWCGPCRVEHPFIEKLAASGVTVHGINYKDDPEKAVGFLEELGDPYTLIGADESGRAGIEWGVYGVPETFIINGSGRIVYKHIGPIQNNDIDTKIIPAIEEAAAR